LANAEKEFPRLVGFMCRGNVAQNFEQNQASAYIFAQMLDFALQFDIIKVLLTNQDV
jgi:hypothetical protein